MVGAVTESVWWLYSLVLQELTLRAVFIYGTILLVSWLASKLFIFPLLSPLRKIPGRPVSFSGVLLGQLPEILRKEAIDPYYEWVCEMKAGIIRYRHVLGSQRVVVADADAIKDILVTNVEHYPRPVFLFSFFLRVVGRSLLTLEGQEHKVQRRLCNSAFKLSSVVGLLPLFQKHSEILCERWKAAIKSNTEGPTQVNIHASLSNLTFDIICEAGFGYKSNSQQDPSEKTSSAFNYVLSGGGNRLLRIVVPALYRLMPTEDNRTFDSSLSLLHSLIHTIISKKKKSMEENAAEKLLGMDLLEMLLSASDVESGAGLSEQQLQDHVMTFMLAGHETTASSLTWILLCMATHPDIQTKAREEVMSHLPRSGQPITNDDLEQLTYINCVVKEALRLFPPAPIIMRQAAKDMMLCGYEIPKGTVVNISIGALHRNPAYWDDPETFKPERFLDESSIPLYTYQPFISGPHMCIGYKFALQELKMTLALLLRQFEFSPLPDVTYRKKQTITMRPSPPLQLYVRCVV
ncbi:cytochrome P450 4A4-like [Littorina saxatilis]|uniref:cytochrome P450 4A4-like n=1 Tax=Littorina saxatilis TaxID=31220 RepID=UPI0038B58DCF